MATTISECYLKVRNIEGQYVIWSIANKKTGPWYAFDCKHRNVKVHPGSIRKKVYSEKINDNCYRSVTVDNKELEKYVDKSKKLFEFRGRKVNTLESQLEIEGSETEGRY